MIYDCDGRIIEIGLSVEVPEPDDSYGDSHNHAFIGVVDIIDEEYGDMNIPLITVRDQDDNCWDINPDRVRILEEDV